MTGLPTNGVAREIWVMARFEYDVVWTSVDLDVWYFNYDCHPCREADDGHGLVRTVRT